MLERRKQLCSGHKGQFDEACAQVNVHKNLAFFTNLKCSLENLMFHIKLSCITLIKYNQYKIMAEV